MRIAFRPNASGSAAWMVLALVLQLGCSEAQNVPETPVSLETQETAEDQSSPELVQEPSRETLETARPEAFPETVARVNGTDITRQNLLGSVEAIRGRMRLPAGDLPVSIYQEVLEQLVDFELLFQTSKSFNLQASSEVVRQEFEQIRSSFPTEEAFSSELATQGMTVELLKESLLKDLSVQALIETEYAGKLEITETAKQQFYEENQAEMTEPERLNVAHILIKVDESANEEERLEARKKIDQVRQQAVLQGSDFGELARQNSDDPGSRDSGGQMTVTRGQTVPEFENAAYALEQGSVSEVVETRFGFHIIKLLGRIPARTASYQETEKSIQQFLEQQELRNRIQSELESLRSKATIEVFI